MAYGLKIIAGNDILQIDSERANAFGMITTSSGVASSLSFATPNTMVFATNETSTSYILPQWNAAKTSVTFKNTAGTTINVNYLLVKPGNGVSGDTSGTYGLQILASNGTTVVFDSRAFTNAGFAPIDIITAGSISSTNKTITTNRNHYVCMNPFYYLSTSSYSGIYVTSSGITTTASGNAAYDILVAEKLT